MNFKVFFPLIFAGQLLNEATAAEWSNHKTATIVAAASKSNTAGLERSAGDGQSKPLKGIVTFFQK